MFQEQFSGAPGQTTSPLWALVLPSGQPPNPDSDPNISVGPTVAAPRAPSVSLGSTPGQCSHPERDAWLLGTWQSVLAPPAGSSQLCRGLQAGPAHLTSRALIWLPPDGFTSCLLPGERPRGTALWRPGPGRTDRGLCAGQTRAFPLSVPCSALLTFYAGQPRCSAFCSEFARLAAGSGPQHLLLLQTASPPPSLSAGWAPLLRVRSNTASEKPPC